MEDMMKLVRFDDWKTGILVQLPSGLHVIDVVRSLGVLSPGDPISIGVLNGILKDRGSWAPLIEHWILARRALRRLALLAEQSPNNSSLVVLPLEEVHLDCSSVHPASIASLEITELSEVVPDATESKTACRCAEPARPAVTPSNDKVVELDAHRRTIDH